MVVPSQGLYGPPFSLHHHCEQPVVGFVIPPSETMVNSDRRNETRLISILLSFYANYHSTAHAAASVADAYATNEYSSRLEIIQPDGAGSGSAGVHQNSVNRP